MDLSVENLVLSYETLASKAVKLNKSYLNLLNLYQELNLSPDILVELEEQGSSPLNVVEAIKRDRQLLEEKFADLARLIANAQPHFTNEPEAVTLRNIGHDCQVMRDFISSIDLDDLKQMFVQLNRS